MRIALHGTRGRYVNHGCRCVPCTLANREYQRAYMRAAYRRKHPPKRVATP